MASFKDVIGHNRIIEYIRTVIEQDRVSHAYILSGEKGAGKKLLAGLFAAALVCEKGGAEPCNVCHSCKQAESGTHPDIFYVRGEKPGTLGVEDIRRQINDTIRIKPYQSKWKVYIVDGAEKMTAQAQNALLKTMEEPPEYAVILLLTENYELLLPTITSRCVMLKLRHLKDTLIRKYLMEVMEVPDYKADLCTAFAQGNLGRAILLANSENFQEIREAAVRLLKRIPDMTIEEIIGELKQIREYKLEIADYLDIIMVWYRDVLLYKATQEIDQVVFREQMKYIREQAKKSSYEGIEEILNALERAKARLKANVNFELVMELLFLTMKEN